MKNFNKQQGFTLIEMIITIILLGIMSVFISKMLAQSFNGYFAAQNFTEASWQGQIAMARMTRDLRDVRSAGDITIFTAGEFSFVDMSGTTIDYKLTGTNLMRNTQVLADGVNSVTFKYTDFNGAVTATAANIHYVTITLNFSLNNASYSTVTSVYLRDLSS